MGDSRTKNTSRNIAAGLVNRFSTILLTFINRTIILYLLGAEFTGLNSLFTSILGVLSIAELGFDVAIIQSMYKPIAEGDQNRVCELLTLYRKAYYIVGVTIFAIGILLIPFLPLLINGDVPKSVNLYVLYIMYLMNSVISYFMYAYKESLLLAHQRRDISHLIRTVFLTVKQIAQAVVLIAFKEFYAYLLMEIIFTILTNIWIAKETNRRYPEYQPIPGKRVKMSDDIKKQLKGLVVGNVCDRARNSLDSIVLSAFLGLTTVAIYNNYYYIYSAIYGTMLVICNSMGASVGNSIVTETVEKNYENLNKFSFIAAWLSGWLAICMLCVYQPFMELWAGRELMLSDFNMMLFCLYFYAINMNNIRNQYISGTGIWWEIRNSNIAEAIANIVLNIVLGKLFGITGIIAATIITIVLFNFLWRTIVLFRTYFKNMSLNEFLMNHLYWFLCTAFAAAVSWKICGMIKMGAVGSLFANGVICLIVPNIILFLLYFKTKQFGNMKIFAKTFLLKIKNHR